MVRGLTPAQWSSATDRETLAKQLCEVVSANLQEAIDARGSASLVVSGGSTPLPFFKVLSQAEIDWSAVSVMLADERWVPFDHADSNARFVQENLLVDRAAKANYISLYCDGMEAEDALGELERRVAALDKPLSVVILGMGEDGHTASLFPKTAGLEEALSLQTDQQVAVMRPSNVPQVRVSLTRQVLINSRFRYLHITGEAKKQVLQGALQEDDLSQVLPIASFFEKHLPPMSVYWSP